MKLKGRLLRQRQEDERPVPVWIFFNPLTTTDEEAIRTAIESGRVPARAWLAVIPLPIESKEAWSRRCQTEFIERERRLQERQAADSTGPGRADS